MNLPTQTPPQGWQFYQPQTGWHAPFPTGMTAEQQVMNIIKHRQANPAITSKHNLSLDPEIVGQELIAFQQARGALPANPKPIPAVSHSSPLLSVPGVAAAVANVKKLAAGVAVLFDWEESGQPPVDSALSSKRAAVCAACPKNDPGGLLKYFTAPVSENIRKRLARLHSMNLSTPSDANLHVCSACLCPLKLKVHTPMNLIQQRLTAEARAELSQAPQCWIIKNDTI